MRKCRFHLLAPRIIMRIPCKITIKLPKLIQVAKISLKQEWCLTISANNPNKAQISYLFSPMTIYVENESHFLLIYTKFNLKLISIHNYWADLANFLHIKSRQNKINLHLRITLGVTSCPIRVTLSPTCGTLSRESGTLGLQRPKMMPTRATRFTNASKDETLALDDVFGYHGDVQGPRGLMSMWEEQGPLGLGLPGCLQRQLPSFSRCTSSISSYPWLGFQNPYVGFKPP
jgi:hypothetical protein